MGWLAGWRYRREITIDHTLIDGALVNFPILLYLGTSSGTGSTDVSAIFTELGANSLKIAATIDDGTTECYVEIETWDNGNNKAWLWVKVPAISNSVDTILYLYYDNTHDDNTDKVGVVTSVPGQAVWDDDFVIVMHLKEAGSGAANEFKDSTSNGHHASTVGGTPDQVDGKISKGQNFIDTHSDAIFLADHADFDLTTAITIECWLNLDSNDNNNRGIATRLTSPGADAWTMGKFNDAAGNKVGFLINAGAAGDGILSSEAAPTEEWHHWMGTYDTDVGADQAMLYKDGTLDGQGPSVNNMVVNNQPIMLSRWYSNVGGYYLDGSIDEFRMSKIARTPEWAKATFYSGNDGLVAYGVLEDPIIILSSNVVAASSSILLIKERGIILTDNLVVTQLGALSLKAAYIRKTSFNMVI